MSHSMTEAELKVFMARKEPPASDNWRPNHKRHKKPYGLTVFSQSNFRPYHWEYTNWYATERARDDAIRIHDKPRRWSPVVAMMKVDR